MACTALTSGYFTRTLSVFENWMRPDGAVPPPGGSSYFPLFISLHRLCHTKTLRSSDIRQASRGPSAHKTLAQSHTCSWQGQRRCRTPGQSSDWSRACLSGAQPLILGFAVGTDNLRRCDNEPAIALEWPCLVAQWLIDEHDPDDGTNATFRRDSNGDGPTGRHR